MPLKRLKWLKYLFVDRTEAETEQAYWNEKRKKHLAIHQNEIGSLFGALGSKADARANGGRDGTRRLPGDGRGVL